MPEKVTITKNKLDSLAEVIGSKSNQNVPLTIEGMEDAVLSLITPIGTKSITENGTYDVTNYANAKINVPDVFVITPTYAYTNDGPTWTIDKTYDEVDAAYRAEKTIVVDAKIYDNSEGLYRYCNATFWPSLDDELNQSYYIISIAWEDWEVNQYLEQFYIANSSNKSWILNYTGKYEHLKSLIEKTITANGTYDPTKSIMSDSYADGYSKVTVNVPPTTLQSLTVTPSTEQQVFNASSQMGNTALMTVYVFGKSNPSLQIPLAVGTNYWLVLTSYSGSSGWADSQISQAFDPILWTATENYSFPFSVGAQLQIKYNIVRYLYKSPRYKIDIYPVASSTAYAPVTVEPIPSEYTVPTLQAKTNISPTTSSQTITADSGYDGLSSVQINAMPSGTAGTPVATKGTVSNNSVTVTPSVTNTTGYITGDTKTGAAVTVSASELVSGTYNITSSGTKDITNYKNVSISSGAATVSATKGTVSNNSITVTPSVTTTEGYINANTSTGTAVTISASELVSGSQTIVQNGTVNVTNLASVTVNVPTGGNITQDANGYLVLDDEGGSSSSPTPSGPSKSDPIRFFDYDGTLVASYTSVPSSLPANPSHTGLIAQGWNWSLTDIAIQFASSGTCDVGQMYTTSDGKTRIYITVSNVTKSFWLGLAPNGMLSIDWGDSSESSSMTGTSYTTINTVQHTYATAGSYVISIEAESGGFAFYSTNGNYTRLLGKYDSTGNYYNQPYGGCVTAIELGDGVRIENYAFSRLFNMKSITIPDTITSISSYAFRYCYALKSITIPDGITNLGSAMFQNCYALEFITIPNSVTSIADYVFQYCNALESITIPNNVTNINSYAFQNCYALESINIPDGVTSLGSSTFSGCYALKSINIPDSVTNLGGSIFYNCYALESITIPDSVTYISSSMFNSCCALKSITIPDTITGIGNYAFNGCYALESINIPDGVTSIGTSTFNGCYALESITIPNTVTSIGSSAFAGCFVLKSITIPNGVTSINNSTFSSCYALESITIPNTVTSIGSSALSNCYVLKSITIPNTVTSINNSAFAGCYALESITVPNNVTSISSSTFNNCYALESITIPNTVTSIATYAFQNCYNMNEYHFLSTTPPTLANINAFQNIQSDCKIYVPYSADHSILTAYQTAENWSTYASYMVEESE